MPFSGWERKGSSWWPLPRCASWRFSLAVSRRPSRTSARSTLMVRSRHKPALHILGSEKSAACPEDLRTTTFPFNQRLETHSTIERSPTQRVQPGMPMKFVAVELSESRELASQLGGAKPVMPASCKAGWLRGQLTQQNEALAHVECRSSRRRASCSTADLKCPSQPAVRQVG